MSINDPGRLIREAAEALAPALVAIRRDIHAHPELAFEETRTAGIVAAELARLGMTHRTGIGGTGVIGEIKPLHPAVVTIGAFNGGTTYNIIPERVHLKGTVRTLHAEARDTAAAAIRRLAAGLEATMRVTCTLDYKRMVPSLVNDDRVLDPTLAAVRAQFGDVIIEGEASMGSEDFSEFAARAPAFQLRIGSGAPGRDDRLHNDRYQPDERCIALGVQALSRAALGILA